MTEPFRTEPRTTELLCDGCGFGFAGPWPHTSVVGSRLAPAWVPGEDGGDDLRCPSCGSDSIGRVEAPPEHDPATGG